MKITIITTCYNRETTIGQAIESVLNQDYPDIEYIVVDGASTDNSLAVIQQYSSQIDHIISERDKGMYEAVNKGLSIATGDFVGLLHSDDLLYSNHTISHIASYIEETDCDLVYGDGLFVNSRNVYQVVRNWISGPYNRARIKRGWLPLHPTVYIRSACLKQVGNYNETYCIASDSDFLIRCLYKHHLKVSYLNEYIVCMRMGGLSTSLSKQLRKIKEDWNLYTIHHFNPYLAVIGKILSKFPQFISLKLF